MNPVEIIEKLMEACKSLMNEVSQREATDWGIVNDAMVEGERYLATVKKRREHLAKFLKDNKIETEEMKD